MVRSEVETIFVRGAQTYRQKVLAHAASRIAESTRLAHTTEVSRLFRAFLKIEERRLNISLRLGVSGCETAARRSFVLDLVADWAFQMATRDGETVESAGAAMGGCALVAVGGYGRAELAPYSDLDILFLHNGRHAAQTRQLVERVLRLLWDTGVTVGHSLHTVSGCVSAARTDPHLQTALLGTRLLAGNGILLDSLTASLERERRSRADDLLATLRDGHAARYAKFGASVCLQEPNVKESAGGLRDMHTALWTARVKTGCLTLNELRVRGLISEDEQKSAVRAYDFLWRVRHAAHLLTGRKTDRLALDLQPALADEFGYKSESHLLASEKFMRDYYRRARELHLFSESFIARASEPSDRRTHWFFKPRAERSAEPFLLGDGRLRLQGDPDIFKQNPLLLFDAFALAQAADVPFSHGLREAISRSLSVVDRDFRASPEASQRFLRLLRRRGRAGRTLRLMHEVGFLGRYLPEFARISLLIQHDLYHHYTVDEHTLKAVEALDELHLGRDRAHTHLRAAFDEVDDPALLYLSILLHDIGKGYGGGHIPRGTRIAERVCRRLQLDARDAESVVLLVRHHVTMSQLAQRRDLNEPRVASDFASEVETLDALNMLLLLTYADLNGVGPGVWSEWKGSLLRELYQRARAHLTGLAGPADEGQELLRYKEQVVASLAGELPPSEVERHIALLPERYTRTNAPEEAATHLRLIGQLGADTFGWQWRREGPGTVLTVCARDRRGLFADVAGTLAAQGIEILAAEVNTREDGIAIDVFTLREAATRHAVEEYRYAAIERALRNAIRGESDVAAAVERWRTNNAPRRRTPLVQARRRKLPQVVCDNEASPSATMIEVHAIDEPGLAYKIASALVSLRLDIVCARVATEKSDALDVFYVNDEGGTKLSEDSMRAAEAALAEILSAPGSAAPDNHQHLRRLV
jgi:[protein-PII] uridylyltransferase